ncbi:twin-arginine translocase TatA/TatE family subunit [Desulforudis sp. DRI-14]|uniref:twin-arginine translocase TatA/TatE family subunit n=1 Tax=Desulforudis sp. DRI-14 TaxID=3459793 RepID=UPI003BBEF077
MPHLGIPELILILAAILIFLGPSRLPQLGKALGRTVSAYRNETRDDSVPAERVDKTAAAAGGTARSGASGKGWMHDLLRKMLPALPGYLFRMFVRRGGRFF